MATTRRRRRTVRPAAPAHSFASRRADAEDPRVQRARLAVERFRKMVPGLTGFAKMITRDDTVRVVISAGSPHTDGKNIYLRPPIDLGDRLDHDRDLCDKRDLYGPVCLACKRQEEIMMGLYHEIAHIAYESFATVSDEDKRDLLSRALKEAGDPDDATTRAGKIKQRVETGLGHMAATGQGVSYIGMAGLVSPYLPSLVNAMEDWRVNASLHAARPGTRAAFAARYRKVLECGVTELDGTTWYWSERPADSQFIVGVLLKLCGYDYDSLSEPVIEALNSPEMEAALKNAPFIRSVRGVYQMAFGVLEAARAHGYLKAADDPEDDPLPEPEPEPDEGDDDGDKPEGARSDEEGNVDGLTDKPEGKPDEDSERSDDSDPDDGTAPTTDDAEATTDGGESDDDADDESGDGEPGAEDGSTDDPADEDSTGESDGDPSEDDEGAGSGAGDSSDADGDDGDDYDGEDDEEMRDGGGDSNSDGDADSTDSDADTDIDSDASGMTGAGEISDDGKGMEPEDGDDDDTDEDGGAEEGTDDDSLDGDGDDGHEDSMGTGDESDGATEPADPEDVKRDLDRFLGHDNPGYFPSDGEPETPDGDSGEPDEPDPEADSAEIDRAIVQGEHFDKPSSGLFGVKELRFGDTYPGPYASYHAWGHGERASHGMTEAGENILGPSLMRMRLAFANNKKRKNERNLKSGRVNSRMLGKRAAVGDPRLFQKPHLPGKRDYFVLIGLDISGSTSGRRIQIMKSAAMAQAELCERAGVKFAFFAHTGAPGLGSGFVYDLDIYIIKDADEPWTDKTRERARQIYSSAANLDGHTLEYYRKVLDRRTETDRVIMYYTDGAMPAENYTEELAILEAEIKTCERKGYTLLAVGVENSEPEQYGMDTVRLDTIEDVPAVVKHLEKRLVGVL